MPIKATDYDKKTPREHILTIPDTYIGDIEESKETLWTLKIKDSDNSNLDFIMKKKKIKFVPGLLKLFDEIIVNSIDFKNELDKKFNLKSILILNPFNFKEIKKKSRQKIEFLTVFWPFLAVFGCFGHFGLFLAVFGRF